MSDDSPQCTCSFGRYSFQQWPLTVENYGCVGGCGGGEFEINNYDGVVKSILLWFRGGNSGNHIRAIRVVYEDGTVMERGGHDGSPASFTFQPGEWIVGDLRLSPSGYGSGRWGSIGFTTNTGRTWNVGSRGTEYYFPTGGTTSRAAYITGFSGASGSDIDRMGVIFWKPIIDTSYTSITYPTLSSAPKLTAPTEVRSRVFCNDGPFELPATERVLTSVVTVGSERCYTASFETTFAFSLKVSGGIPFIKEAEATAEWSTTFSAGLENCRSQTDTRTETLTFPSFQIPPQPASGKLSLSGPAPWHLFRTLQICESACWMGRHLIGALRASTEVFHTTMSIWRTKQTPMSPSADIGVAWRQSDPIEPDRNSLCAGIVIAVHMVATCMTAAKGVTRCEGMVVVNSRHLSYS